MFKRKKQLPESSSTEAVQFEKNIKTLWIYTTLFCLFALVLIVVSSVIQGKINSKAEYYQDQYEDAKTSSQSTIKNIQDENAALKRDLDAAAALNEQLTARAETDALLIGDAAQVIETAEYLLAAQRFLAAGNIEAVRTELMKVDFDILTNPMRDIYLEIQQRLG